MRPSWLYGASVEGLWYFRGVPMVVRGRFMVLLWWVHGVSLLSPPLFHGESMVLPCSVHGGSMVHCVSIVLPQSVDVECVMHGASMVLPW